MLKLFLYIQGFALAFRKHPSQHQIQVIFAHPWIDRGTLEEDFRRILARNWEAFNKITDRSNDYSGIIIPGGSGIGKTRTGQQAVEFFKEFDFGQKVKILHLFCRPYEILSPIEDFHDAPKYQMQIQSAMQQLSQIIASAYFSGVYKKEFLQSYQALSSIESSFFQFDNIVKAIWHQEQMSDNIPIILVLQLDEFNLHHKLCVTSMH